MAELLEDVESNILKGPKAALDYRSTQMAQCSMTGVAAALVAQVANSSLQLQYMPTIHWIVPALCTSSLIIGLLCVYYSFLLHYRLARYTCGKRLCTAFTQETCIETGGGNGDGGLESGNRGGELGEEGGEEREGTGVGGVPSGEGIAVGVEEEGGRTRIPSYQATFLLWLPFFLLMLAITLYILAITSYWFVAFIMDLQDSSRRSWRVVFHVLISLVFQADNEFLDFYIHHVDICHGSICSICPVNGVITGLSSLQSESVRLS